MRRTERRHPTGSPRSTSQVNVLRAVVYGCVGFVILAAVSGCGEAVSPHPLAVAPTLSLFTPAGALRASDGQTRWTHALGTKAPLLADGTLYAITSTTTNLAAPSATLSAVQAADGTTRWTFSQAGYFAQPLVVAGRVIVPILNDNNQLTLVALDVGTGRVAWRSLQVAATIAPTVDGPLQFVSALTVANGAVVASASHPDGSSFVAAWSVETGALVWSAGLRGAGAFTGSYATIVPASDSDVLTVAYRAAVGAFGFQPGLIALDAKTGTARWQPPVVLAFDLVAPGVIVSSDAGSGVVTARRPRDGATMWQRNLGASVPGYGSVKFVARADSALIYRRFDACGTGTSAPPPTNMQPAVTACPHLYALDVSTGTVLWDDTLPAIDPAAESGGMYGNHALYYQFTTYDTTAHQAHTHMVALNAATGAQIWSHEVPHLSGGAVAQNGAIFEATFGQGPGCTALGTLAALDATSGGLAWSTTVTFHACALAHIANEWIELG